MTSESDNQRRALAFNAVGPALKAAGHSLPLSVRKAVAEAVLAAADSRLPAEHCGAVFPAFEGMAPTECVLRPGHQGSHANDDDTRWIEKAAGGYCPDCGRGDCAPTADEYEQLRRRLVEQAETALGNVRAHLQYVLNWNGTPHYHRTPGRWDMTDAPCGHCVRLAEARAALEPPKEQP